MRRRVGGAAGHRVDAEGVRMLTSGAAAGWSNAASAVPLQSPGVFRSGDRETGSALPKAGSRASRDRTGFELVGPAGFELATSWSQTKRTTKLCYGPTRRESYRGTA